MIVDASAIVAILRNEPLASACARALADATSVRMSAVNFVEAAVVIDGARDPVTSRAFDQICRVARIVVEPVTVEQARLARDAYRDFGTGSGHAARLNFGDCFAYALARERSEPLLFIGNDFVHTDITAVLGRDVAGPGSLDPPRRSTP